MAMAWLLLAANWKMHKTVREAVAYAKDFLPRVQELSNVEMVLCPPFTALHALHEALEKSSIQLGAQDVFWKEQGAFTGEISAAMLKELGVTHVLVGHSERRQYANESNAIVAQKLKATLQAGLIPILCVGEQMVHRKAKKEKPFVQSQLAAALDGINASAAAQLTIAYEPLWAISRGDPNHPPATPKQAQEMHAMIREWLGKHYTPAIAAGIRIIYGGSANAENCRALLEQPAIDGLLPGNASLDPAVFATMAQVAESVGKRKA